jgi:hypothetical protein
MPNPLSNRKKVRGWKRRVRQLERWRDANRTIDVASLLQDEYRYLKISLDPWNRLVSREPPQWLRKRILQAFVEVQCSWTAALLAAGEPYYLRLWLFHPRFHRTQLVVAVRDRILWYEGTFAPAPAGVLTHPPREYDPDGSILAGQAWTVAADEEYLFPQWLNLAPDEEERVRKAAAQILATEGGETYYVMRRGLVWLGSPLPSIAKND